jgi:hypothetical protein
MRDDNNPYAAMMGSAVAYAEESTRTTFIRRTYTHLLGAILAFIGLETLVFQVGLAEPVTQLMLGNRWSYFIVIALFVGAGWLAQYWAHSATSLAMQYAGLGLYVLAQVVIFIPILYIAQEFFPGQRLVESAALITLATFAGLTAIIFMTRADLSFMGKALAVIGIAALVTVFAGALFGFSLGIWFTGAMIALACAYILYDTSMILHHYTEDRYVGAALELFASVAMLFYQILLLLMRLQSRD